MPVATLMNIKSVVSGSTPSYSLEAKLGDCRRAAAIRREALQRSSGRSLEGLPLEGFDYDWIELHIGAIAQLFGGLFIRAAGAVHAVTIDL